MENNHGMSADPNVFSFQSTNKTRIATPTFFQDDELKKMVNPKDIDYLRTRSVVYTGYVRSLVVSEVSLQNA